MIPGLSIDLEDPLPVYRQIAEAIRRAALDGRLTAGDRLPPTRDLARDLRVNRNTVVAAYARLAEEGWVTGATGRGTFLVERAETRRAEEAVRDPWSVGLSRAVEGPGVRGLFSFFQQAISEDGISFGGSYPAADLMPVDEFAESIATALAERGGRALGYGPTAGDASLREWIAGRMRGRGSSVDAEEILISHGAQQAIDLVFHALLERGDTAIIEEPTYTGALSVLGSLGARTVGVGLDAQGMRPDLLAAALERHRARLIYLQPTFHNPTTAVMDLARRQEILGLAARYGAVVVEDDWADGLRYEGEDPPTLHALSGERVIYLSAFSKKLLPGLRIGWIAAPRRVLERLVALKQIRDCGSSPLLQAGLEVFLRDGGLKRHLDTILPAYRRRRDTMLDALDRHFPASVARTRPAGGLFVWLTLPRDFDGHELFRAAQQQNVSYTRGDVFHGQGEGSHHMRLTFSSVSPAQIERGIEILGGLVRERWQDRTGMPRPVEVVPIL